MHAANITSDPNALWLQKPPDADVCVPYAVCLAGSYISQRCSGSGTQDDRKCSPCNSRCPVGLYMHCPCSGGTFNADSNDCRCVTYVHVSAPITYKYCCTEAETCTKVVLMHVGHNSINIAALWARLVPKLFSCMWDITL